MNLWQSTDWRQFQKALGRKTYTIQHKSASALLVRLPLKFGKYYFLCQNGPIWQNKKDLTQLFKKIKGAATNNNVSFTRVNPLQKDTGSIIGKATIYSKFPQTSLIVDLTKPEEDILKQMKQKCRYNIKLAKKHGVKVQKVDKWNANNVKTFYNLLSQTTKRNAFHSQNLNYYIVMLKTIASAELYFAKYKEEVIAAGIFCFEKNTTIYYYGASSNKHRNLMAPYLLQWTAILEAKERGCKTYDFLGIQSTTTQSSSNMNLNGVTKFKTQFGGEVISYPEAKDIVYHPLWYNIYRLYKLLSSSINR